jgi:hypothetical protein
MNVVFQFESSAGEKLGSLTATVTPSLKSLGEKVLWRARGLVSTPDDLRELDKYFVATAHFGKALQDAFSYGKETLARVDSFAEGSRLTIDAPWDCHRLPWEAAAIESEFLGTRYVIKRVVRDITSVDDWSSQDCGATKGCSQRKELTIFLGEGPGLVGTASECNLAEDWMRRCQRINGLNGEVTSLVTVTPSCKSFMEQFSSSTIFHYAGHAKLDRESKLRCFAPEDCGVGGTVTSADLENLTQVPEYSYLNGCGLMSHAAVGAEAKGKEIPLVLLKKGARWLVGPTISFLTYRYFELIRGYYRNFRPREGNPAAAMWEARRYLVRGGNKLSRELPLALHSIVYGREDDWYLLKRNVEQKMSPPLPRPEMTYPTPCCQCGTKIQTRHGNYAAGPRADPLCRSCHQKPTETHSAAKFVITSRDDTPSDRPLASVAASNIQSQTADHLDNLVAEVVESDANLAFRRKLGDNAQQFTKFYQPDQQREIACELVRSTSLLPQRDPSRPFLARKAEVGCWTETMDIAPAERRSRSQVLATLVVRYVEPAGDSPLDQRSVEKLLAELDQAKKNDDKAKSAASHRYHIVVSATGFHEDAWKFIEEPDISWRSEDRSILIHDPLSQRTSFTKCDRWAYSLEGFFRTHAIDEQFQEVMSWLEQQLPLRQSVSVRALAERTGFSQKVVESAIRIFARRHQLATLESEEFGFCLEDSLVLNTQSHGRQD